MKVELWAPTEYGYELPKIRYNLSKRFIKDDGVLLDYWSWNGSNTILFYNQKREIYWVEVEEIRCSEAIKYAKELKTNIHYQVYDWEKLPFHDHYFDNIISFEVIEHTKNDFDAVKELYRVLKHWGTIIITVPNKRYLMETHWFHWWLSNIIPTNRIPFLSRLPTCIHEKRANARIYTKSRISELMEKNGFTITHHEYIMPPLDKLNNKFLQKWWRKILSFINSTPFKFLWTSHFIVWIKK